mmetsp:Transcript_35475/g.68254  ORF Transcript_35475/g.68254 Transcript_35475/m.68254 type:complete len:249 (-) Transcript_35475:1136-1882(-)
MLTRSVQHLVDGALHHRLCQRVDRAPVGVPQPRLHGLVAFGRRERLAKGAAELKLALLSRHGFLTRFRLRRVTSHPVARHLEHEHARVALGELAAVEKVEVREAGRAHQRVRANFLLQAPAQVDARLHRLDLGGGDCVCELLVRHGSRSEQRGQTALADADETLEVGGGVVSLGKERAQLRDRRQVRLPCGLARGGAGGGRPYRLGVGVLLGHAEELAAVGERRLGHGDSARVQPLPDHLKRLDRGGT